MLDKNESNLQKKSNFQKYRRNSYNIKVIIEMMSMGKSPLSVILLCKHFHFYKQLVVKNYSANFN